jgi:hypothetical protein
MPTLKRKTTAPRLAPTTGYTTELPLDPFHARRCTICHHPSRP